MAIQLESNQIQDAAIVEAKLGSGAVAFAKLKSADIETSLAGSSSKIPRADAVKNYVDAAIDGRKQKDPCVAGATANVDLGSATDGTTQDGVTVLDGQRVALLNQDDASENGPYVAVDASDTSTWTRTSDADTSTEMTQAAFWIQQGSTYGDKAYVCTTDAINLGTTNLTFVEYASSVAYIAGDGLDLTGVTFSVKVDDTGVEISSDTLQLKDAGVTNAKLAGSITAEKLNKGTGLTDNAGNLEIASGVAGDGLALASQVLSVNVDDSSIETNADALRIKASGVTNAMLAGSITAEKLNTGTGLTDNAGNLEIASGVAGDGLALASQVLSVNVDDSSIETNADALRVKASGVTNAMLAGSITAEKLNTGAGLTDNAGNLEIASGVAGDGLALASQILSVNVDDSTIETNSDALRVKAAGIDTSHLADDAVTAAKVGFASTWDVLAPDGVATAFDLSGTVDAAFKQIIVIRGGAVQKQVAATPADDSEYTVDLTGGTAGVTEITFGSAPANGVDLRVWFML
jgi:hypothetical protein